MFAQKHGPARRTVFLVMACLGLTFSSQALGHGGSHGPPPSPSGSEYRGDRSKPKPRPPEPYHGQKVCPVTGEALGAHGPAIPVETMELPSSRPGFFGKLLGRKPKKAIIYVCCSDCVARVKANPGHYLQAAIAQRGGWREPGTVAGTGPAAR